jgi:DNA uptake protein ComE-like DNA-binding protein
MKQALWKTYCSFSRKERQGIILLLLLTFVCMITPALWEHHFPPVAVSERDSVFMGEVAAFRDHVLSLGKTAGPKDSTQAGPRWFYFDPNTLAAGGWMSLGVEERVVRTIQRYLAKGGRFRRKQDLQRVYGLSPQLCAQLMPYVQIAEQQRYKKDTPASSSKVLTDAGNRTRRIARLIDINKADSTEWESLPGIGPVLAARIVKFRDRLGGFYAIQQVGEIYGLPDSTFNKIQPSLRLHEVSLKKLDINQMDEKSLAQHPYIRYKLARLIVRYRSNHGPFRHPEGLLGIPLVDDSIYRKIEPYIKIENSRL